MALMSSQPIARHLLRAKDLADARLAEPLTVADLAESARLSSAHFSREFRRAFGETPHAYLLTRRLERAATMLRMTDHTVADICPTVGLSSVGSFTTTFSRVHGKYAVVPVCIVRAYGRPHNRTFREDIGRD